MNTDMLYWILMSHRKLDIRTIQATYICHGNTPFKKWHSVHRGLKLKSCPIRHLHPILTLSLTRESTLPHNNPECEQYDQANLFWSYQTLTAQGYRSALYLPTCSHIQTHISLHNFKQQKWHQRKICNIYFSYMPVLLKPTLLEHNTNNCSIALLELKQQSKLHYCNINTRKSKDMYFIRQKT